jgi:hypothetical protein
MMSDDECEFSVSPDQVSPQPDVVPVRPRTAPCRAAWVAVVLLTAALAAVTTVAVHYRADAVYSSTTALPTAGRLAGTITVFTAHASSGNAQIVLSARISGGLPRTRYELSGNDCTSNAADHTWASGVTNAHGSATLTGPAWMVSTSHEYFLGLSSPRMNQSRPGPAVHGFFGRAPGLSAISGGFAPCSF